MIVRHSIDLVEVPLPNPNLRGKQLVATEDGMNYTAYDVFLQPGETVCLTSPPSPLLNHVYYCVSGSGTGTASNGRVYEFAPDVVVAFSSGITCTVKVTSGEKLRLFCIFCDDVEPSVDRAVARSLSEIVGTDRDIDWGRGHIRRFLRKSDGFPISVHNANGEASSADTKYGICYKHHVESVYFLKGRATYTWEEGAKEAETRVDAANGTIYNMNAHDPHHVTAHENFEALCVFHPVLVGNENHDFSQGYSGYKPSE
ncbi:PREDICTED: uncharacterized protein LOC109480072 [Branchiostoma belcheri]|uniref:L-ectoine synthase n=1 Tax=Branchiostoma belcheri TaxID=7741 RepID=A0A6P4Z8P2_BRABE|nr:PREDICTED: uncharacterized protein LOC109480072 [Branchiostoma belcheri]